MKYLNIGDAYIGRDGIVSVYPRGYGLDACCIPARDVLDPSRAKQREVKAYIEESLNRAGRLGVMDSKRVLEDNIAYVTDPEYLAIEMNFLRSLGLSLRFQNVADASKSIRQNEVLFHLGLNNGTQEKQQPADNPNLPEQISKNRASDADGLFELARNRVKAYAKEVHDDQNGAAMIRANESMQSAHAADYQKMPPWVRKLADENGVAILCGGKTVDPIVFMPYRDARRQTSLIQGRRKACFTRGTSLTIFSERAFHPQPEGDSVVAEEVWHQVQDRFFPQAEKDPALRDMLVAMAKDAAPIADKVRKKQPLTPGEERLMVVMEDAARQKENGSAELFANIMQELTNPALERARNNLCQHAPETAKHMMYVVNHMEREAKTPATPNHQTDYGLGNIPVFAQGRARAPIQL